MPKAFRIKEQDWIIYINRHCNGYQWIAEKKDVTMRSGVKTTYQNAIIDWNDFADKNSMKGTIIS